MVHLLNARTANVAVAGPWGTVDVTSEAKLYSVNFDSFALHIRYLDMTFDMLVFGNVKKIAIHLVFFVLDRARSTIF
jgi:hypothetical protein